MAPATHLATTARPCAHQAILDDVRPIRPIQFQDQKHLTEAARIVFGQQPRLNRLPINLSGELAKGKIRVDAIAPGTVTAQGMLISVP